MTDSSNETGQGRPLARGEVFVFSEANFGGDRQRLTAATPGEKPRFPIASIQLGPKTGVTLFEAEDETGLSQDLTVELASFAESRFSVLSTAGQKPQSVKIWQTSEHPYSGGWAFEVGGRYLSVSPDRILTTSDMVTDYETFHITCTDTARGTYSLRVLGTLTPVETTAVPQNLVTIDDLQSVALTIEEGAGFRKFSLLSADDRYLCYNPDEEAFFLEADPAQRAIFTQSIKIADNESQVGELTQGEAALFENPAYWGKVWVFHADYPDFNRVGGLNDQVSSIQIGPMTGITIYRDIQMNEADTSAPKMDVTSSLYSLKEEQVTSEQISSMDMWRIVPPEKTGITYTSKLSQDFHKSEPEGKFIEYSVYRTTLCFPSNVETVDLATTDEMDIEVDGLPYHVEEDQFITLRPNIMKRLVVTTDAVVTPAGEKAPRGCLRAPGLKIHTNTMKADERLVIHPDQEVHRRLAGLEQGEMWEASYRNNGDTEEHKLFQDRSTQQQKNVDSAQGMITKIMSTVKYTGTDAGGWEQAISADGLGGKSWALDFSTYRVTVRTLFVREGPDTSYKKLGYLMRNQVVQVLGFNVGGDWVHIKRLSDGLTGWSFGAYLGIIRETPTEAQYRVKAVMFQVREGPATNYRQVGLLNQNEIVTAVSENEDGTWLKIARKKDNLTGWCSAQYLEPLEPTPAGGISFAPPIESGSVPVPPQTISGLKPIVQFREVSQEEVQTLLAQTRFPETDLAQGFWDICKDIFNAVKEAVQIVVTAAEKTWAVIVKLGKEAAGWIVDTADRAIACVEAIIEKIGAVIDEIVKWLRWLFDWGDILDTRRYINKSINTMLDYIGNDLVLSAKTPVRNGFEKLKGEINRGFDQAIERFGGSPEKPSSEPPSGHNDAFEAIDWVLSKVLGGGTAVFGTGSLFAYQLPPGSTDSLQRFWTGQLAGAFDVISAPANTLTNIVSELMKHPDQPQRIIAAILTMFKNQLNGLLDLGENLVLGMLDLIKDLIAMVKSLLNADIRIPFISDLIDWINSLSGLGLSSTLGCSFMDIATLILAIPVTIISKAVLGHAPFSGVPNLALGADGWTITAGLSGYLTSLVSIPLDMTPEGEELGKLGNALEVFSLIFSTINLTASWGPNLAAAASSTTTPKKDRDGSDVDWLWWGLYGYDAFVFGMDCASFISEYMEKKDVERARRSEKQMIIFTSILGGIHLVLIVAKKLVDGDELEIITDGLMTLPEICAPLRLSKSLYASAASGIVDTVAGTTSLAAGLIGM